MGTEWLEPQLLMDRPRSPLVRALPLALILSAFWLYYPLLDYFQLGMEDEGELLYFSHRLLEGQFPNRDFFTRLPPLCISSVAAFWAVFGQSLAGARFLYIAVAATSAVLLYFLGLRLLQPRWSAFASLCYLTEFCYWPAWSQNWTNVPLFLLAVLLMVRHTEKPTRFSMVLAGLGSGLCGLNTQYGGFVAFVLGTIVALTESEVRAKLRRFAELSLGFALVMIPYLLCFFLAGALEQLWEHQILFPFFHYASFNKVPYQFFPNWSVVPGGLESLWALDSGQLWQARGQVVDFLTWPLVTFFTHSLFYPVVLLSTGLAIRQWWKTGARPVCVLAVGQLGLAFLTVLNGHPIRVGYVRVIWWVLLFWMLQLLFARLKGHWRYLAASPLISLLLAVFIQAGCHRARWSGAEHWVKFPRGAIRMQSPELATGLRNMMLGLDAVSKPGDMIFIYPWNSLFYFLSGRENPGNCDRLLPFYTSDKLYEAAFASLEENDAQLKAVLLFRINIDVYLSQYPNVPKEEFTKRYAEFGQRLYSRFRDRLVQTPY